MADDVPVEGQARSAVFCGVKCVEEDGICKVILGPFYVCLIFDADCLHCFDVVRKKERAELGRLIAVKLDPVKLAGVYGLVNFIESFVDEDACGVNKGRQPVDNFGGFLGSIYLGLSL